MITFSSNVVVPRTEDSTGMPKSWIFDGDASAEARGFLGCLLSYTTPGVVVTQAEVEQSIRLEDRPVSEIVAELVERNYLIQGDGEHYELVHPARLDPLPPVEP